jgi:hypothetical protein
MNGSVGLYIPTGNSKITFTAVTNLNPLLRPLPQRHVSHFAVGSSLLASKVSALYIIREIRENVFKVLMDVVSS